MKRIAILAAILAVAGCGRENTVTKESTKPEESPGVALRQMALTTPVDKLDFSPDADFPTVYGVLTEWDIDGVTATVMSMRDGTASTAIASRSWLSIASRLNWTRALL